MSSNIFLPEFSKSLEYKVLERVQRDICYEKVGFKSWLVNPVTKGTLANTTGCKEFNLFTGIAHNYDPTFEIDTNKFNLLTNHLLEVWCGGNIEHHNWLLSWLANIIQRPQQKIYTGKYPEVAWTQVSGEDRLQISAQKLYEQYAAWSESRGFRSWDWLNARGFNVELKKIVELKVVKEMGQST